MLLALNPLGIDILDAAVFSGDPLSRAIWRPILLTGIVLLCGIAVIEWQVRIFIQRRRAGRTPHS